MKKRFIAGAVCPKCSAMDRLVMFEENNITVRECVECGFTDSQRNPDEPQQELETRVNQVEEQAEKETVETFDPDIQPVRILH